MFLSSEAPVRAKPDFCKPNLMQANTSFVVLDPKGEQVRAVGNLLREKGYEVKSPRPFINMEKSHCYNPVRLPS